MGMADGDEVFEPVAEALIELQADPIIVDRVCTKLATALVGQDWDTADESVDRFCGYPVVQHAIRKAQGWIELFGPNDHGEYRIEYDPKGDTWFLITHDEREIGRLHADWKGFNALIRAWTQIGGVGYAEAGERYLLG